MVVKILAIVGTCLCVFAGQYLLALEAAAENSMIEYVAHGIGWYFLAKAVLVGPGLWALGDIRSAALRLSAPPPNPLEQAELKGMATREEG